MIYTLENEQAILKADSRNGEIAGFRRKDKDIEYMWEGDPQYWAGRNPTLFPHVSSPSGKILNFKGKDYRVNNHGFCRKSEFTLKEQGDDYLIFVLDSNEETRKEYPYEFSLELKYTLSGTKVSIDYTIINKEDGKLYFGFGQHPAFRCPLTADKSFADYYVEFEKEDVKGRRLNLSYELFEQYPTYLIKDVQSRVFTLSDGENSVIMRIDDKYKLFALWTPHAPFVCLEPWVNTIDQDDNVTRFEERDNIVLAKGETYQIGYSIEIV